MGQVPKQELLLQNGLREYRAVVHAMKTGNIGLMDDALAKVGKNFKSSFLIFQILARVLFRQIWNLFDNRKAEARCDQTIIQESDETRGASSNSTTGTKFQAQLGLTLI